MARVKAAVKTPRLSRSDRARQTRRRLLRSARERFLEHGYGATTMEQIAIDAGVAIQTVYYTFRTKGQLLRELIEVTAAGEENPPPVGDRAWNREMLASDSPQRVLALAVEHGTAIYDRVAELWPAVAAAAGADPAVAEYWGDVAANRRGGLGAMVQRISDLGGLRPGLDPARATDLAVLLIGHDPYRGLVVEAGWSVRSYRAWLYTTLVDQLLSTSVADPRAVRGISFRALINR
jgi:AcrR family transcriptional regulator